MKNRNLLFRIFLVVVSFVLIAAMALCMTSCGKQETTDTTSVAEPAYNTILGDGSTSFKLVITDADGKTSTYTVNTDKKTVGDALLAVEMISGTESEYGLMVDTVDGIKADYNKDGAYWAFYIDGEYAQTGVSETDVVAGSEYSFVYTKG